MKRLYIGNGLWLIYDESDRSVSIQEVDGVGEPINSITLTKEEYKEMLQFVRNCV